MILNEDMNKYYYKIWVSLFFKIKTSQNENEKAALLLSLIVLTLTNIINYYLICYLLMVFFKIDVNVISLLNFQSRVLSILFLILIFLLPNYFLIIWKGKYLKLIETYQSVNKNLGLNYFLISCIIIISFVFFMIAFPESFGLKSS